MKNFEKEFVPYDPAIRMKGLGFDEPCLGCYSNGELVYSSHTNNNMQRFRYSAPLYQQAFRWFRKKGFEINSTFHKEYLENGDKDIYEVNIEDTNSSKVYFITPLNGFKSFEEAELACLTKLIEIVEKELIN